MDWSISESILFIRVRMLGASKRIIGSSTWPVCQYGPIVQHQGPDHCMNPETGPPAPYQSITAVSRPY